MELLLLGETITAERAKEIGLVWEVYPHEELLERLMSLPNPCRSAPIDL